jgi:poly-gamma-glutamate synthesis protein (capsule biosynthesis protein)
MDKVFDNGATVIISCKFRVLVFIAQILLFLVMQSDGWCGNGVRLVFTGDIMLSRNVSREIDIRKTSPWIHLKSMLQSADLLFGNFEGAVADSVIDSASKVSSMTFSIPSSYVQMISEAGFTALSVENNHNMDLGPAGRIRTIQTLTHAGISAIDFEHSPRFFRFHETVIAIIAVNLIPGKDHRCQKIPSIPLGQKIRLAKNLADLVILSVHWGSELLEWPNNGQREAAHWLIGQGADMIIGHHPHVIQQPEIIDGKPVFYSLGNHVFDQKYPGTKEGLVVECTIQNGILSCTCLKTRTAPNSFFPEIADTVNFELGALKIREPAEVSGFTVKAAPTQTQSLGEIIIEGFQEGKRVWQTKPIPMVSIEFARLDGEKDYIFSLERHYSNMDHETGLRPYVYSVTRNGLVARWRGSALAWPLHDAVIMPGKEQFLCVIHRGDSFILPDEKNTRVRFATYQWNGFGFSGTDDSAICNECQVLLN